MRTTIFLAYAERDGDFARELAAFLESGCDATCYLEDGAMPDGGDLMAKAKDGLAADVLALLLSEASWPERLPRQKWEPVLFEQAREAATQVSSIALGECPFPELLRRRNFFDASADRRSAMRMFKRWIWLLKRAPGMAPEPVISRDLESVYAAIADEPGVMRVNGAVASRFAREAADEFEAILWVTSGVWPRFRAKSATSLASPLMALPRRTLSASASFFLIAAVCWCWMLRPTNM